jgi:hypothetical protein
VPRTQRNKGAVLQWGVVAVVGVVVVAVVLGLRLIPRLNAGQHVLDGARPAFTAQRVAADRAGVNIVSQVVDMADPIVNEQGGAAAEVPTVVSYVAKARGVTEPQALAALTKEFPHTTALLHALPLDRVTAEEPTLIGFLAKTLKLSPAQVSAALQKNFPAINQAVMHLPTVTAGWEKIPNTDGLTRFDGTAVRNVPQLRDYFSSDVVSAVEHQQGNFRNLDRTSKVNWIAPLLLVVGFVVIALALVMVSRHRRGVGRTESVCTAAVVPLVGIVVVALVLGLRLIPRTSHGQDLIDGLKPAMTSSRVAGDRAGIEMVSAIVDTADPLMTDKGGAAAEVPKLVDFVAKGSGLTPDAVLKALQTNFPHTTGLLQALPLTAVSAELPAVTKALQPALGDVPHLAAAITALPKVTGGWLSVPGTSAATTRFDGSRISSVPDVRNYFSGDVIPVLETQRAHFHKLASTSSIAFIGPLVLVVGLIVVLFGFFMVAAAGRPAAPERPAPTRAVRTGRGAVREQSTASSTSGPAI